MSKGAISLGAGLGGLLGAYVPVWLGRDNGFGGWSVLGAFLGGILGIIIMVKLVKTFIG